MRRLLFFLPACVAFFAHADVVYFEEAPAPGTVATISRVDLSTGVKSTFVTGTTANYVAAGPHFYATDATGNVYIANLNTSWIVKASPAGNLTPIFTRDYYPNSNGLGIDSSGNLYIASVRFKEVIKQTPTGAETVLASGLDSPSGISLDPWGNIYTYTSNTSTGATVLKITPAGGVSVFATNSGRLWWSSDGTRYAGSPDGTVTKTTTDGTTTTLATGMPSAIPLGLRTNGNLCVWQFSSLTLTISEIQPDGNVIVDYSGRNLNAEDVALSVPEPSAASALISSTFLLFVQRRYHRHVNFN